MIGARCVESFTRFMQQKTTFNCRLQGNDCIVHAWPQSHSTELRAKSKLTFRSFWSKSIPAMHRFPSPLIYESQAYCETHYMKLLEGKIKGKKWFAGANKKALTEWSFSSINDVLFEVGLWRGKSLSTKYFSEMKMRETQFKIPHMGIKPFTSKHTEDEVGHCMLWFTDLCPL